VHAVVSAFNNFACSFDNNRLSAFVLLDMSAAATCHTADPIILLSVLEDISLYKKYSTTLAHFLLFKLYETMHFISVHNHSRPVKLRSRLPHWVQQNNIWLYIINENQSRMNMIYQ
jgi:hypothetical protein